MDFLSEFKQKSQKIIDSIKEDLKTIRTGRANPSLVENLIVETYGGTTKLKLMELSTITTEGPTSLLIIPFDPSVTQDIEKAILKSPLGLSPSIQGTKIILRIPPLSSEQREKYIKLAREKIEERKNQIRSLRDDLRRNIKNLFEKKEITEDIKYRFEKEIDNQNSIIMKEIDFIKEKKENEIREL
ncbi:MAG: ribosome recycling factor [Patescibacteria group bacterium]|nr:ribosome recycling factor [Patescibacteria group bacterium]